MKTTTGKSGTGATTPLMQQYNRIKAQYPDAILLFRVGDFYETFDADARTASRILGITLTKRNNGGSSDMDLAGFPYHSLETYLPRLVRAGHRVAVCDQLEDPKLAKTVVERGVTEVVTPGVSFSDRVVDNNHHNWLAAVCHDKQRYGVAFVDVTTGEFAVGEGDLATISKFIDGHAPTELLYARGEKDPFVTQSITRQYAFALEDWAFNIDFARERLLAMFGTNSLKGFGIEDMPLAQQAAGAILHYLGETRHERLGHINRIGRLHAGTYLGLDRFTVRNLEVVAPLHEGARTLLSCMDRTTTPMGARMLKRWLLFPLLDRTDIEERHARVDALLRANDLRTGLREALQGIGDLERLVGKAAVGRINPREVLQLGRSIGEAERVHRSLSSAGEPLSHAAQGWAPPLDLAQRIIASIEPEAPVNVAKCGVLRAGVDKDLDELRHVTTHAKELLMEVQQRETERTGITSLKVGYNNVFGYYLEVRNTHKDKVPAEWTRKQTLTGAERYITEELKSLEERILSAEERIQTLELQLFGRVVEAVIANTQALQVMAASLSQLDVLISFAETAITWKYVRPKLTDDARLEIHDGRHPVIEQQLPPGEPYVANDLVLDPDDRQMVVITGPNMSGKSALLRQTALHVLMAQCGSFVPARTATIGIVDRLFTRVGASDDISTGESTFMVEMNETASILHNLTDRSLVLLDEIGRGTSTYDGISIAWSIAEFLHEHPGRPKTLFATHYHELNEMSESYPRIRNANVAVREVDGRILFLRKLVPGGTDRSFGIHVARMAGMPPSVIERAQKVLHHLERSHAGDLGDDPLPETGLVPLMSGPSKAPRPDTGGLDRAPQLSIFQLDDPALEGIRDQLEALDIDTLTPVEALLKLNEIKRMSGAGKSRLHKV